MKALRTSLTANVLASSVIACALATWIIADRFSLSRPSLIDDWWNITVSSEPSRFRPAYTLWNYVQWHLLGAPESLIWPNVANVGRVLLLVAGLAALTALALGAQQADEYALGFLALVLLPPLLVVTVPQFDVDLARFGPQEPILVGGLTLGGSLLFLGCCELAREDASRRRPRIAFLLSVGYLFWLLGVYQKEASVCAAVVAAVLALASRHSLRRPSAALEKRTRVALAAVGAAALLPVAHVGVEIIVISREHSESVIGAGESLTSRARNVGTALESMPSVLGTPVGWGLLVIVAAGIAVRFIQRRPDWTQVALLLGAFAFLAWSTQVGLYPSRYFIPFVSLLAVAFSRLLSQLPPFVRWASIVIFASLALLTAERGRTAVESWTASERKGISLVDTVARLDASGCPVVIDGLDVERAAALPVLVRMRHLPRGYCRTTRAFLISDQSNANRVSRHICATRARDILGSWPHFEAVVQVTRCRAIAPAAESFVTRNRMR